MQCDNCKAEVNNDEIFHTEDMNLCEDCYLDKIAKPKTCDPWAVFQAKQTAGQEPSLTELQQGILDYIQENWPVTEEQICTQLNLDSDEFRTNFSILRHMELARGCKVNNKVCFAPFNAELEEE